MVIFCQTFRDKSEGQALDVIDRAQYHQVIGMPGMKRSLLVSDSISEQNRVRESDMPLRITTRLRWGSAELRFR